MPICLYFTVLHLKEEKFSNNSESRGDYKVQPNAQKDVSETPKNMMNYLTNLYQLQWSNALNQNSQFADQKFELNNKLHSEVVETKSSVKKEGNETQGRQNLQEYEMLIKNVVSLAAASSDQESETNKQQQQQQQQQNTKEKPDVSYFAMVAKAIQQSERGYVILNDIYSFVLKNYPYYENAPPSWKISIRHQLSTNSCFVKVANIPGQRGFYWSIHPACKEELARGSYRTALQKVRHTTRRYLRGRKRMQRYMVNVSKTTPMVLNKQKALDSKPKVPDGYALMQSTPIPQNHPFYFLSRPEFPYENYVTKHNEQSWQQEVNLIKQDTCTCESQQQVLRDIGGETGPSRIFTEFAQNHVMPCSSGFDDFM